MFHSLISRSRPFKSLSIGKKQFTNIEYIKCINHYRQIKQLIQVAQYGQIQRCSRKISIRQNYRQFTSNNFDPNNEKKKNVYHDNVQIILRSVKNNLSINFILGFISSFIMSLTFLLLANIDKCNDNNTNKKKQR